MKSVIQNVKYLVEKKIDERHLSAPDYPGGIIVTGNSDIRRTARRKPLPDSCKRRLAGIFYADIANYARLTEQDEAAAHIRLIEAMKQMKTHVVANNGRIAHFAGDAILAEFKDAESALHCAINVQLAARHWNAALDLRNQVWFRIGINFDEVIVYRGDLFGKAVNLAARLESLSCTGGVCVSARVHAELGSKSEFKLVTIGKHYVKNIDRPVEAFWVEFDSQPIENPEKTGVITVSTVAT